MKKEILQGQKTCDETVASLFRSSYFLGKQSLPYSKFSALCKLLVTVKSPMTLSMYQDEKYCADLMMCISVVIQKRVFAHVKKSAFYGVMIDESTDISVTRHLVVFATIIEENLPVTLFFGLVQIEECKNDSTMIYETLISSIRKWGLDLKKFVGFGSDCARTMVGNSRGVDAQIKEKVNPYILACHCVAHRTNLVDLDAAKSPDCKVISFQVDSQLNSIAGFFNKSSKHKHVLSKLQEEFIDVKKLMKRYHKIRWLSQWQAVTTLCESLDSVLTGITGASTININI